MVLFNIINTRNFPLIEFAAWILQLKSLKYRIIPVAYEVASYLISAAVKTVVNVKQNRNLLMKFHTQYTSITDELENVCQMITSPTLSSHDGNDREKQRGLSDMSNAEFAALIERQHLKECEENDYVMLSKLFSDRCAVNDADNEVNQHP